MTDFKKFFSAKNTQEFDREKIQQLGKELLTLLGENPDRPGLRDTPKRWSKMWEEFICYEPGTTETCFEQVTADQMVVVKGLRVYSFCEHHLLPFWCDISIGYIARDRVLGLSKFARIAHQFAHKLQLQERLCQEIADEIKRITGTEDVAVLAEGEHSCMVSRGIRTQGMMVSSVTSGVFREQHEVRSEFLQLVKNR